MARPRDIKTNQADVACDVCGRTLLRGEHAEALPGRRPAPPGLRAVHRARPARGLDPRVRRRRPRAAPSRAARAAAARFSTACARAASGRARSTTRSRPTSRCRRPHRRPGAAIGPRARARRRSPSPRRRARPRHVRAVPTNAELKMERALDVFNASEHPRTVGGVARSLGAPAVSRAPARRPPERRRDHRHVGAVAGTASRSTSPTRPAACGATPRATSCPSSRPRSRSPTPPRTSAARLAPGSVMTQDDLDGWSNAVRRVQWLASVLVIYCVVPEALADELYDKLAAYYEDDPNVDGDRRPPQAGAPRPGSAAAVAARGARPAPPARDRRLPAARVRRLGSAA